MICIPRSTVAQILKSLHQRLSGASLYIYSLGRNQAHITVPANKATAIIFPQNSGILFSHSYIFHLLFHFRPFFQSILDTFIFDHQAIHQALQFFNRFRFEE